jgi:hypothetical protein
MFKQILDLLVVNHFQHQLIPMRLRCISAEAVKMTPFTAMIYDEICIRILHLNRSILSTAAGSVFLIGSRR